MGINLASLDHKHEWSHLVDKVARYVDWCIQYRMAVQMARGGGQMFNIVDYVNGRMDRSALEAAIRWLAQKETPRGGGRTEVVHDTGSIAKRTYNSDAVVAKLYDIGMENWMLLARLAKAFVELGGEFERKARESEVYWMIGGIKAPSEFYFERMFGGNCGAFPVKNEFCGIAPALG